MMIQMEQPPSKQTNTYTEKEWMNWKWGENEKYLYTIPPSQKEILLNSFTPFNEDEDKNNNNNI